MFNDIFSSPPLFFFMVYMIYAPIDVLYMCMLYFIMIHSPAEQKA